MVELEDRDRHMNGVKQHNRGELSLHSLSTCHVVMLQSRLVVQFQKFITLTSHHALAKHLASAHNSVLQNIPIKRLAFAMWSLLACRQVYLFAPKVTIVPSCEEALGA